MRNNRKRGLVCECAETAKLPFEEERRSFVFCDVSAVNIDEITAGLVEKEAGRYVSVSFGSTENMDGEAFEEIARVTSDELGKLILRVTGGKQSPKILVAGLGNEGVTHDSLGARVVDKEVVAEKKYAEVTVNTSLWNDVSQAGASPVLALELSDIYAWTIDFFGLQKVNL